MCITPVFSGSNGNCDNGRHSTRKTLTTGKLTSTTKSSTKPTTHPTTKPMTTQTTAPKTEPSAIPTVQNTEKVIKDPAGTSTMIPIRNCQSRNITAYVKTDGERPLIQITENYSTHLPLGQHTFRFEKDGGIFCIIHVMVTKGKTCVFSLSPLSFSYL